MTPLRIYCSTAVFRGTSRDFKSAHHVGVLFVERHLVLQSSITTDSHSTEAGGWVTMSLAWGWRKRKGRSERRNAVGL